MKRSRQMRVSSEFEKEMINLTKNMNMFLSEKGEKKQVYPSDITDIFAKNAVMDIQPMDLIPTGRKGKRITFYGEMRL